jgi:formate dehydrogenase major subunit
LTTFLLDGKPISANDGETILQAAERHGVAIPHLCYTEACARWQLPRMRRRDQRRRCARAIMRPQTCRRHGSLSANDRALHSQRMVLELLLSDAASSGMRRADSELTEWCSKIGLTGSRFVGREQPAPDLSHPGIQVHLDACIQCTRCVRACREVQVNDVIGYAFRGSHAFPVFDLDDPMGASSCVACGECVQACPTGAILPKLPSYV